MLVMTAWRGSVGHDRHPMVRVRVRAQAWGAVLVMAAIPWLGLGLGHRLGGVVLVMTATPWPTTPGPTPNTPAHGPPPHGTGRPWPYP